MAQQDLTVQELVNKLKNGTLRLPELQRGYVWRAQQVVDLFDSLYRGYPSGTILTWVTDQDAHSRELAIEQDEDSGATTELLLDGQQRLTSLSAVLNNESIRVKGRKWPIRLMFNLDHQERSDRDSEGEDETDDDTEDDIPATEEPDVALDQSAFAVASPKLTGSSNWIPVADALKSTSTLKLLRDRGIDLADEDRLVQYEERINKLRAIRSYKYRVDTIEQDKSYDEVADIFVRINGGGTHLRGHDLALAHITATWPGSLRKFEEYDAECDNRGFTFGFNVLLKTMLVFAIGQSRFRHVSEASRSKLEQGLGEGCRRTQLRDELPREQPEGREQ